MKEENPSNLIKEDMEIYSSAYIYFYSICVCMGE